MVDQFSKMLANDIRRDIVGVVADIYMNRDKYHTSEEDNRVLDILGNFMHAIDKWGTFRMSVKLLWDMLKRNSYMCEQLNHASPIYDANRFLCMMPYVIEVVNHIDEMKRLGW